MKKLIVPAFNAIVDKEGILHIGRLQKFREWIRFNLKGKDVQVIVRPRKKIRSNQENRYYWGVVIQLLSEHTGYTPDEVHELCKVKFLPPNEVTLNGAGGQQEKGTITASTAMLGTMDFENYLSTIRLWAQDFYDLIIPLPNEVDDGKF